MTYNVNIYYSEEEVHDAFKSYYNVVKQYSDVHIFTKNALPFSLYDEDKNVFLHSQGSLWDRLKAWMAGEEKFEQQFSLLNISKENSERYRTLINKGGIIVVSKEETIVPLIKESIENKNPAIEEDIVPPLLSSSVQNDDEQPLPKDEVNELIEDIQTTTETTNSLEQQELNDEAQSEKSDPSSNTYAQSNDIIDSIEPNEHQQNLFIADVSSTNQGSSTNQPQYEYYEGGPRKHNLYSEKLQQLLSEQEQIIQDVLNSNTKNKDAPGNDESGDYVADVTIKQPENTIKPLTANNSNAEDNSQQHQDIVQKDRIDHNEIHSGSLAHFVQQLSPDDAIRTFTLRVLSNLNVPTDSTESVLDKDLQAILEKLKSDEVRKLFPSNVKNEINIASSDLKDITTGDNSQIIEAVVDNPFLDESSQENSPINLQDDVNNTSEQMRNDSQ